MPFVLVAMLLVAVVTAAVIGVGCSLFGWWLCSRHASARANLGASPPPTQRQAHAEAHPPRVGGTNASCPGVPLADL
jgi:hypothetical protein